MTVNCNDMYVYLECAKQLEVLSILDAGMLFRQIGGISRGLSGGAIDEDCYIAGIDMGELQNFPVYNVIYNTIISIDNYRSQLEDEKFDLGVMLGNLNFDNAKQLEQLLDFMSGHCKYLIVSMKYVSMVDKYVPQKVFRVDDDMYALFNV